MSLIFKNSHRKFFSESKSFLFKLTQIPFPTFGEAIPNSCNWRNSWLKKRTMLNHGLTFMAKVRILYSCEKIGTNKIRNVTNTDLPITSLPAGRQVARCQFRSLMFGLNKYRCPNSVVI